MKSQYVVQFEEIFSSESVRGERVHWKINWLLYSIILLLSSIVYFIQDNEAGKYGMILSLVNLFYNLLITRFINREKPVLWVRYVTMSLNVMSLTAYIYMDAINNSPNIPVTSAAILIFPVIIFFGALRMDKRLIVWTTAECIVALNALFFRFYNEFDLFVEKRLVSMDILSQVYRTIYLGMCGLLVYSVPLSMMRVLKKQQLLAQESLEHKQRAFQDALTGVYNRFYFDQHLSACIQSAVRNNHKIALLYIDLNGFKQINDTYGHDLGDMVLKSIAEDITSNLRPDDVIARIGGDEFVVVMSPIYDPNDANDLAHKLLTAIKQKRFFRNIEFSVGASIGISIFKEDTDTMEQMIKYADKAMYTVKKSGKDGVAFYEFNKGTS
ncbi:GGDEF domain-containing protein [Clostridium thermarum]|uniref:GGDEF domain-containing protein n=1 Tax=Clostridium thermarum TaxID=1716543 RepID=UPI0013D5936C|nr:GGDEF domain-containing protein [Clostridium thermarum]